jgi:broad-specificity NMP kinase
MQKHKLIIVHGAIGIGKLTTAMALQKKTGYKLLHNHMVINLAEEILPRGEVNRSDLILSIFKDCIEFASKYKKDLIITHAYSSTFVYQTGVTDKFFIKQLAKFYEKYDGEVCPVFLTCEPKTLLERASSKDRNKHKKLTNKKALIERFTKDDFVTPSLFKNNLIIETTKLSSQKVADKIIKHFNL